ncbi:2-succinyl-5-enolpyruvyl-6-hydroxy-3-cyclohexene-1-carboxylic-acid synthase [Veillonella atypica]|uniref:2-succinyl-5-enolpyruvyl-6-hydroxy-3- cyclohexene-1-carboxylic-acid synthase n=1 Tax=Veillonella atypica TaxID=39777 RepID=UPI00352BDF4B
MNEYIATLVDEFAQLGITHAVFSPGSRSTTMAMLFREHGDFETYMNIDERSAGFMALGIAKAHRKPVILVCTSGSAVAHYMPAVLEAQYSGVPLIILSADRPHTLQHVGAPQTVDQQKLFGTAVNYYEELAVPQQDHYYTYPRLVARKAYMKAMDVKRGPVHINVPLFEPLVPELDKKHFDCGRLPFSVVGGTIQPSDVHAMYDLLKNTKVLILAGPSAYPNDIESILALSYMFNAPILGDPLSNMRSVRDERVVTSYDAVLTQEAYRDVLQPDCILQIGQMVVSKRVQQWVASMQHTPIISVSPTMDYTNPAGNTTLFVQSTPQGLVAALKIGIPELHAMENEGYAEGAYEELDTADNGYLATWIHADEVGRKQLDTVGREQELFEGRTIHLLQELLPQHSQIVVANSMSIRDMDYFWSGNRHSAIIYGNRGVNGIDGTVSTALGIATNGMPTVLLTGDLTFFHDLNGLAVAKTHPLNLTIIVHNNDGGGIFEYLPQKGTPHFDYLFSTAQGLDYSGLATLYGIDFVRVASNDELKNALQNYVGTMGVHVIEIPTSKERSRELHKKYTTIPTNKEDRL